MYLVSNCSIQASRALLVSGIQVLLQRHTLTFIKSTYHKSILTTLTSSLKHACPKVQTQVWLGPDNLTPFHEFVGPELIAFFIQPRKLRSSRTLFARTGAIKPVIRCDEVASWVTNNGDSQLLHGLNNVKSEPILIDEMLVGIVWVVQASW
jgi:hypothetical protein